MLISEKISGNYLKPKSFLTYSKDQTDFEQQKLCANICVNQ